MRKSVLTLCFISLFFNFSSLAEPSIDGALLEQIGPDLHHPWGMDFLSEDQLLVSERAGQLFQVDLVTSTHTAISGLPKIGVRGQGGLLDVLIHPADKGQTDPRVFYCYSKPKPRGFATAIDSAVLVDDQLIDRQTLFTSNHTSRAGQHFGCRLVWRDGVLYASLGDRGDRDTAQDTGDHSGSIIAVPIDDVALPDRPDSWAKEIYSIGHRNPQGMALDPDTGALYAHEHGPQGGDEINLILPGANYGWPRYSHGEEYGGGVIGSKSGPDARDPLWVWVPSIAPSGMAFYQGEMFPSLKDHMLVGSLKFKSLYAVQQDGRGGFLAEHVLLKNIIGRIRDVSVAADGSVLLLTDAPAGGLYRLYQAQ